MLRSRPVGLFRALFTRLSVSRAPVFMYISLRVPISFPFFSFYVPRSVAVAQFNYSNVLRSWNQRYGIYADIPLGVYFCINQTQERIQVHNILFSCLSNEYMREFGGLITPQFMNKNSQASTQSHTQVCP